MAYNKLEVNMLSVDALREFGADVDTALARCLNKEDFYLKLVKMGISDERYEKLGTALEEDNLDEAFEICHALKGVIGNLALEPLYKVLSEMTELLRSRTKTDYTPLYNQIKEMHKKLVDLASE